MTGSSAGSTPACRAGWPPRTAPPRHRHPHRTHATHHRPRRVFASAAASRCRMPDSGGTADGNDQDQQFDVQGHALLPMSQVAAGISASRWWPLQFCGWLMPTCRSAILGTGTGPHRSPRGQEPGDLPFRQIGRATRNALPRSPDSRACFGRPRCHPYRSRSRECQYRSPVHGGNCHGEACISCQASTSPNDHGSSARDMPFPVRAISGSTRRPVCPMCR